MQRAENLHGRPVLPLVKTFEGRAQFRRPLLRGMDRFSIAHNESYRTLKRPVLEAQQT